MPRTPKNRDATAVYPGTSPKLVQAYRVFGPGHDSLEALAEHKRTILGAEGELTRMGEDLAISLGLDTEQIISAYKTYKKEIKRMNKAERNHNKRKRRQLDGGADTEEDDPFSSDSDDNSSSTNDQPSSSIDSSSSDHPRSSIEHSSSPSPSSSSQQRSPERKKTLEELLEKYLAPPLYLPRDTALSRTQAHRASLDKMHTTAGSLIEIYTTRLPYTRPLAQAMHHLVTNLTRWRADAARAERLIALHDNTTPTATWTGSPDTNDVTCGPRVAEALCMFWELDGVVGGMKKSLARCEDLRRRFMAAGRTMAGSTRTTKGGLRRRFYHELVFNMRRFAAMCVIEELRGEFVGGLEEERRRWSPESSPDEEEYDTDFVDFSSDSESEGEGEDGGEGGSGGSDRASDTAASVQE